MFIVKPEIGEKAWIATFPYIIKGEIFMSNLADIIKEIGHFSGGEKYYKVKNFYVPIRRIALFHFGGIVTQNDKFDEHKCLLEDEKMMKDYCSKAGKQLNVTKIIEQSWWLDD